MAKSKAVRISPDGSFLKGRALSTWLPAAQVLLIFAAVFWIYWPCLRGDWLWDDTQLIRDNPLIHDPAGWWKIWLEPGRQIDFQPITSTVFWLEWHLFGHNTLGYHTVNVLLHAACAFLVWRLFAQLGLRAAWLGGLFFAVHPVQVESVAWMAELKNVVSLPLFLLACLSWLKFNETPVPRAYVVTLGWFLAALLAKATVVMFPCVLLLHAWWRRGRLEARDLRRAAPFFALALAVGGITLGFLARNAANQPQVAELGGPLQRFGNAGAILGFYLSKVFWDAHLDPVYYQWPAGQGMLPGVLVWTGCAVTCGVAWWHRASWGRDLLFGFGFFVANLLPFLGLTGASYMAFTWAMDHLLYLPIIGLIGLGAAAISHLCALRSAWGRVAVLVPTSCTIVVLAALSRMHAQDFRSSSYLWRAALRDNPQSWLANEKAAEDEEERGFYESALNSFDSAVAFHPNDPLLRCNLGRLQDRLAHYSQAMVQYDRAVSLDPHCAIAYCGRGVLLTQLGRTADAMADYQRALAINPDYAEAHSNLGVAFTESGRLVEAMSEYQKALALNPDYIVAHANLGDALGETGHFLDALQQYQEVLRLDPRNAEAHYNSGVAMTRLGRISEAISEYKAALAIDPNYTNARHNLSALEHASGGP